MPEGREPFGSVKLGILLIAIELWYSAVIRSNWLHGDETARDLSRKVADWRRFSLWSNYDLFTKRLHVVVLGWPPKMRENFQSVFQGESGIQLQRHPMILHAYFARNLILMTYDFLQEFSGPLYEWVSISTPPLDRWKYLLTFWCGNLGIQSSTIEVSKRLHGESTNLPGFFAADPTSPY